MVSRFSSMSIAKTTRPLSLNSLYNLSSVGNSHRHHVHQVAQKSSKTSLPRKSDSFIVRPCISLIVKSGAGVPGFTVKTRAARIGSLAASTVPQKPKRIQNPKKYAKSHFVA